MSIGKLKIRSTPLRVVTFQDNTPRTEGAYTLPAGTTAVVGTGASDFTVSGGALYKAAGGALPSSVYLLRCNDGAATQLSIRAGGPGWDIASQGEWWNVGALWYNSVMSLGHASNGNLSQNLLTAINNPQPGTVVTINAVAYTFQTAVSAVEREVKIGATLTDSLQNLTDAINMAQPNGTGNNQAGGTYYVTAANAYVSATTYVDADGNWTVARGMRVAALTTGTNTYSCSVTSWTANQASGGNRGAAAAATIEGTTMVFRDGLEFLCGAGQQVTGSPFRRMTNTIQTKMISHNFSSPARIVDRLEQNGGNQAWWGFVFPWHGMEVNSRINAASDGTAGRYGVGFDIQYNTIYAWRSVTPRENFRNAAMQSTMTTPRTAGFIWLGGEGVRVATGSYTLGVIVSNNDIYYPTFAATMITQDDTYYENNRVFSSYQYPWRFMAGSATSQTGAVGNAYARGNQHLRMLAFQGCNMQSCTVTTGSAVVTCTVAGRAVEGGVLWGASPTYSALACFPADTTVLSVASDGQSFTASAAATGDYSGTIGIKPDGLQMEQTYSISSIQPHVDMGIHTGSDTQPNDWTIVTEQNILVMSNCRGTSGPRAMRDNDSITAPYDIVTENQGLWVTNGGAGGSHYDMPNIKDCVIERNTIVTSPDYQISALALNVGYAAPAAYSSGTHAVGDNISGSYTFPYGGDLGTNTSLGTGASAKTAMDTLFQRAGAVGYLGDRYMPLTFVDAVSTFAPVSGLAVASGGAMNPDGTYRGALFPNGAWNDGSVYDYASYTWRASHPPIFDGLLVTP